MIFTLLLRNHIRSANASVRDISALCIGTFMEFETIIYKTKCQLFKDFYELILKGSNQ